MKDIQLLIKKDNLLGKYTNIYPKTYTDAIIDKESGKSLHDILLSFNMYFLNYTGNTATTRLKVPAIVRKKGLWITYVKYDGNVYTEWYAANEIDDKSWGDSSNWRIGNNTLVGDITISANGNWVINGTETEFKAVGEKGNTPLIRVANNRLQVSYDLGETYLDVTNNPVYTKFRWLTTTGDTQANNVGRIQASTDEGKTWTNMSNNFINNLHISKYIGANESLPTRGIAEGTIYAKGPTYNESDTSNSNPIYRLWVYAWKGNTLAWQDNGEFTSISAGVVQETGNSETNVMSQKATSKAVHEILYDISAHNDGAVFESLSALLSSPNLSTLIPTSVRHGGTTIRFIQGSEQSSDNKYVQYRYMETDATTAATFTNVANWQGVDDEPTAGSDNLVKSNGVQRQFERKFTDNNESVKSSIILADGSSKRFVSMLDGSYVPTESDERYGTEIELNESMAFIAYKTLVFNGNYGYALLDTSKVFIEGHKNISGDAVLDIQSFISKGAKYLRITSIEPVIKVAYSVYNNQYKLSTLATDIAKQIVDGKKYDVTTFPIYPKSLNISNQMVAVGSCRIIDISDWAKGLSIAIKYKTAVSPNTFAFLKAMPPMLTANANVSSYLCTGQTGRILGDGTIYTIPADCKFILLNVIGSDNIERFPSIKVIPEQETMSEVLTQDEICEYYGILSNGTLTETGSIGCTRYIDCKGVKKITIPSIYSTNNTYGCVFYDASKNMISAVSQNGTEFEPKEINVPGNAYYVRFNGRTYQYLKNNNYLDKMLNVEMKYSKGVLSEDGKRPYQNGFIYFSQRINQKENNFWDNHTLTTEEKNADYEEELKDTTGVLILPTNYRKDGKPCPIIMYVHGTGNYVYYDHWGKDSSYNTKKEYYASLGFAVFDCNGARNNANLPIFGAGAPQDVAAYKQCFDYIKQHYNVEDSVYVIGASGGGITAVNYCRTIRKVKAFAGLEPGLYVKKHAWDGLLDHSAFILYYGLNGGYTKDDFLIDGRVMPLSELPASGTANKIYLIKNGENFSLYKYINDSWSLLDNISYNTLKMFGYDVKDGYITINDDVYLFGFPCPVKLWIGHTELQGEWYSSFINAVKRGGQEAFLRCMPEILHNDLCSKNTKVVDNDIINWFKLY